MKQHAFMHVAKDMVDWCIAEGSPFESPLLSSPGFLALLSPVLTQLNLCDMRVPIGPDQFAAICQLTNLKELDIQGAEEEDEVCFTSACSLQS
jgi:hypothetical protein